MSMTAEQKAGEVNTGTGRFAIVNMPWGSGGMPSIQLGTIAAICERAGFEVDQHYLNLELASRLTPDVYEPLCRHRGEMTGEWLFGIAAFGDALPFDEDAYFAAFPDEREWAERHLSVSKLVELRRETLPRFVDDCAEMIDWSGYFAIGFSSTFQQNVASLALARRIKEKAPHVDLLFGGANMESEMGAEILRSFPYVDYGVSGEAEDVLPVVLGSLARGERPRPQPGLLHRESRRVEGHQAAPVQEMDELPTPSYGAYFTTVDRLDLAGQYAETMSLPVETSRGCWWGAKHHCTFCGLNGLGMGFRSKSPERVLSELSDLGRAHRITRFEAVDNILDPKYLSPVFGRIEESRTDFRFFFEVKSNLSREKIRQLRRGGVERIQPGIESMSTQVLRLMRKGCTMLQNVVCLKWSLYYGIGVSWNLLWGFPGETEDDYAAQLDVLKAISHLEPPMSSSRVWLERFSPFYTRQDEFGVHSVAPRASYGHAYPEHVDQGNLAYFFDYIANDTVAPAVHLPTQQLVERWREQWASSDRHVLTYRQHPDAVFIDYDRGPDRRGTVALSKEFAAMYVHCNETPRTPRKVRDHLQAEFGLDHSTDEIRECLDELCAADFMLCEDDRYLGLALPSNPNW